MAKIKAELTPIHLRCTVGACPAVYLLDDGDLLIVGKRLEADVLAGIAHKVTDDEFAIRLHPSYLPTDISSETGKK